MRADLVRAGPVGILTEFRLTPFAPTPTAGADLMRRLSLDGPQRSNNSDMSPIVEQLGRFWWWIQQGGNSTIVLVVITAWYSWLTFCMLRWSAATARTGEANRLMLMNEQRAWLFVSLPPSGN
jgi:hypothetical protein